MRAIVAGPDEEGIREALAEEGVDVTHVEGTVTRPDLEDAGILETDLYVLTDVGQSTTVPIVRDLTDEIRTVVYDRRRIPEFVRGQVDLAIDPAIATPALVAEELAAES